MKRISIFLLALFSIALSPLHSQLLTPFKGKDGLSSSQTQANLVRTDSKIVAIATASGAIPGVPGSTFDFNLRSGKANAWLYLFRSSIPNDTLISYGVVNVFTYIATQIPISSIPSSLLNNPYSNLSLKIGDNSINSDRMGDSLFKNPLFDQFFAKDSTIQPSVCVLYQNEKDTLSLLQNNPYWLTVFGEIGNSDLICFTNALSGATKCYDNGTLNVANLIPNNSIIYPNPASNVINISLNNDADLERELAIFNSNGALVKKVKFNGNLNNYQINDLINGSYIAIVTIGEKTITMPLAINR